MSTTSRTVRYLRAWASGRASVRETELGIEREGGRVPARLILPAHLPGPYPGWVVLHGVTRPGLDHPQLVRFSRALGASGAAVIIPEVPEWKDLRLAPEVTAPTVEGAISLLDGHPEVAGNRYGLIGFSFGGPHALVAAAHHDIAPHLAGVVSFGGYCDLLSTVRFQLTGEHEWGGRLHRTRPDPYGRWVVASNFLTAAPGYQGAGDVARALWKLAAHTAESRIPAWLPDYDSVKERLREKVAPARREIFDLFAPRSDRDPDRARAEAMLHPLVEGGHKVAPLMEPRPLLGRVHQPVQLLHGRGDRLIPYTESARLKEALPSRPGASLTVTRLFAHSTEEVFPKLRALSEAWAFFRALQRILDIV